MSQTPQPAGPVHVVGVGLLGTSVALAARRAGREVTLADASPEHVRTASGLGAGRPVAADDRPALVVVAVPPDHLGAVVAEQLERTDAVVTDVGSVKAGPLEQVSARVGVETLARYVGSHPMAGGERSGPLAATASLFDGRPWAVTPHAGSRPDAVAAVETLVAQCGASVVRLTPDDHDAAVARISHLPHLAAVLVAARLDGAPGEHLALAGQGVRDVTRIAASDPALWRQIIGANSSAVRQVLAELRDQLDVVLDAVDAADTEALVRVLEQGVAGTRAIPGKHGGPPRTMAVVVVAVPDHPGELARLFADLGAIGVNVEDVRIDHDPGREVGLVEVSVDAAAAASTHDALEARGWVTHR